MTTVTCVGLGDEVVGDGGGLEGGEVGTAVRLLLEAVHRARSEIDPARGALDARRVVLGLQVPTFRQR